MKLLINLKRNPLSLFFLVLILSVSITTAQDFGPYTEDGSTILLMHFDGDLVDASGTNAAGIVVGDVSFSSVDAKFGQAVYLNNSGVFPNYADLLNLYGTDSAGVAKADSAYYTDAYASDTSYIVIPANAALDLTGDWTIEGWIKNVDNQY